VYTLRLHTGEPIRAAELYDVGESDGTTTALLGCVPMPALAGAVHRR
jgi:hypothetical protein